jgi:crotonobetainyl-CoA:carnitine CoA-transferase CaiB-like acyl-CoA transferase
MERPDLAADARFSTNIERTRHHRAIDDIVSAWCASLPLAALSVRLDREEVPFSKVYSIADVVADPHLEARQALVQLQDPVLREIPAPAAVPRFVRRVAAPPGVGPETGQHNAEIYAQLGLGSADLERLRLLKAI